MVGRVFPVDTVGHCCRRRIGALLEVQVQPLGFPQQPYRRNWAQMVAEMPVVQGSIDPSAVLPQSLRIAYTAESHPGCRRDLEGLADTFQDADAVDILDLASDHCPWIWRTC